MFTTHCYDTAWRVTELEEPSLKAQIQTTPAHTNCFEQQSNAMPPWTRKWSAGFLWLCFFRFLKGCINGIQEKLPVKWTAPPYCSRSKPGFWLLSQSLYPKWNNQTGTRKYLHLSKPTHPQKKTSTSLRMELCTFHRWVQLARQRLSKDVLCLNQGSYPRKASSAPTQEHAPKILWMCFYLPPWSLTRVIQFLSKPTQLSTAFPPCPSWNKLSGQQTDMQTKQSKFHIFCGFQNDKIR